MDSMEARLATNAPSDSKMRAEYGIGARDGVLDAEAVAVDVANVSSMPTLMAMDLDPDRERADAVHARAIENGAGSAAVSELAACSVLLGLASAPAPPQHHASDATMSSYQPPSNRSSPSNSSAHHQQQLSHSQIHPDLQLAQPVNYLQTQYAVLPDSPSQVQNQRLAKHHRLPSISTLLEQLPPLSAASPVDKPSSNMPITPIPGPAINRETVEIPSPTSVPPPITLGPAPIAQPSYSRLGSHPHHGHGQGHRPHSMHKKSYSMGSFDFIHSIQNQSQREHGASVFNSTSGGLMGGSGARIRLPQPQLNQPQQPLQIAPKLPSYTVHYPPLHASQFVSHPAVPQQQHLQPHGQQQDASANLANSNTGDVNSSQAYHAFHKKTSSMDSNGSTSSSDFGHHPHVSRPHAHHARSHSHGGGGTASIHAYLSSPHRSQNSSPQLQATPASGHLATQRFEAQPLPPQSQPFARHPPTSQGGNPPPMVIDIRYPPLQQPGSATGNVFPPPLPGVGRPRHIHHSRQASAPTIPSTAFGNQSHPRNAAQPFLRHFQNQPHVPSSAATPLDRDKYPPFTRPGPAAATTSGGLIDHPPTSDPTSIRRSSQSPGSGHVASAPHPFSVNSIGGPSSSSINMDADEDEDSEPVQLNANGNPIKRRLRANREQLRVLESVFDQNRTPSPGFKKDLAKRLGMPHKSILYWFQNRRAMLAREQKRLHTGQVGVTSMQGSEDAAEEELDGEGDER